MELPRRRSAVALAWMLLVGVQGLITPGGGGRFFGRRPDRGDSWLALDKRWLLVGAAAWPGAAFAADLRFRSLQDYSPRERLASIPVFFVANGRGSPYLLNREKEGAQECVIFVDPADAESLVNEMTQASPQLTDARVFCIGLDRALAMAQRKPTLSGNVDRNGRELTLRYRIQPSQAQVDGAKKKLTGVQKRAAESMLPCFIAPDLEAKRGGVKTTPVFLALEDLRNTYGEVYAMKKGGPKKKEPKQVLVYNLIDLILSSEQPDAQYTSDFGKLVFFPMPEAVNYVRKARKRGNGVARLHATIAEPTA